MAIVEQEDGHRDINLRDPDREHQMVDLYPLDLELLKQQRETLHAVIDGFSVTDASSEETADHLSGIENLLDTIWDQLVPVELD